VPRVQPTEQRDAAVVRTLPKVGQEANSIVCIWDIILPHSETMLTLEKYFIYIKWKGVYFH
jgi:hypothetical protein